MLICICFHFRCEFLTASLNSQPKIKYDQKNVVCIWVYNVCEGTAKREERVQQPTKVVAVLYLLAQFLHIKIINAENSCYFMAFTSQLRRNKGAFQLDVAHSFRIFGSMLIHFPCTILWQHTSFFVCWWDAGYNGVSTATLAKLDFIVFGPVCLLCGAASMCPHINFNKLCNNSFNFIYPACSKLGCTSTSNQQQERLHERTYIDQSIQEYSQSATIFIYLFIYLLNYSWTLCANWLICFFRQRQKYCHFYRL